MNAHFLQEQWQDSVQRREQLALLVEWKIM